MKLGLVAAASVVALAVGSGTVSAQYPVLVPHRGHYHVVPSYPPPVALVPHRDHFHVVPIAPPGYGGYGRSYSPGYGYGRGDYGYRGGYRGPSNGGHNHNHR